MGKQFKWCSKCSNHHWPDRGCGPSFHVSSEGDPEGRRVFDVWASGAAERFVEEAERDAADYMEDGDEEIVTVDGVKYSVSSESVVKYSAVEVDE